MGLLHYDHCKSDFEKALNGYRLTTAEITYHLPDHPSLLQTYIWQDYDFPPHYPKLMAFLKFWEKNLDGPIEAVHVMMAGTLKTHSFILPAASYMVH